jgi:trimeric autotransporter adhesin
MKIKNYIKVVVFIYINIQCSYSQVENAFYGENAGVNNTANFSTAIGINALYGNSGNSNNAFGWNTLTNSFGGFNCAFGNDALRLNSTGNLNSAFGTRSLENNTTGSLNIAVGHRALGSNTTGSRNTAIGYGALTQTNGDYNIAVGFVSPRNLRTGNSNIFIGNETGVNLTEGNNNVFIGNIRLNNSPTTNRIAGFTLDKTIILADGAGNQRLFISGAGNTGLGLGNNIIPNNRLDVNGAVVIGKNYTPSSITSNGFVAPANGLLVEGKVGLGTTDPKNKLEISHGTDGFSGLRFTNLTSNFIPSVSQTADKFLSVNQNGDVVLQKMVPSVVSSNVLSSSSNLMTSNVSGLTSSANIVNSISNYINSNNQLVTTVNGVSSAPIDLPLNEFIEVDDSITNELQTLSQSGNTITLSHGGGSFVLPTFTDNDSQTLSLSGNVLTISNGNSVSLPVYSGTDSQNLSISGNTISISNGNSITIPNTNIVAGNNVAISGNGSASNPYQISSTDTSIYANNGIINQATTVNSNRIVDLNNSNLWFNTTTSSTNGKLYVGSNPNYINSTGNYKLFVEGGIMTEKIKVALRNTNNWADYVFEKDYKLLSLDEVENFVIKNKHLPGIQSAKDLAENGIDVVEMQSKQMEKIEELTLYIIDQNKKLQKQNDEIQFLKNQMNELMQKMK